MAKRRNFSAAFKAKVAVGRKILIGLSCSQVVHVVQTTKHGSRDDLTLVLATGRWHRRTGSTLSDRSARTPMIEIGNILSQGPAQVALIEDEYVIETLGSGRSYLPLGDRVGLG